MIKISKIWPQGFLTSSFIIMVLVGVGIFQAFFFNFQANLRPSGRVGQSWKLLVYSSLKKRVPLLPIAYSLIDVVTLTSGNQESKIVPKILAFDESDISMKER